MNEQLYCQGCGAPIQTENKQEPGYVPESALHQEQLICQRCFRLKNYNEVQDVNMHADDFLQMLHDISDQDAVVVNIVDLFDVHGSFIPGLKRFVGNNPIVLVGNKVDLLPKSTNLNKVKLWLRNVAKEYGLIIEDVFLVSSVKGTGIEEASLQLDQLRQGKDVYVVGCTNVGKSTFINHLIHQSVGEKDVITTSYFPGTTLGFIEIPLDEQSNLIDTPGIINDHQMAHFDDCERLEDYYSEKRSETESLPLNDGQTLFVGGMVRLDISEADDKYGYICYFSNRLSIHRTKTEKAEDLYENHLGEMLSPPSEETIEKWPALKRKTFHIHEKKMDIVVSGLGWITIPAGKITVDAYAPEGVNVIIREAII